MTVFNLQKIPATCDAVYKDTPPTDHIRDIAEGDPPTLPAKPSFGLDSWIGLAASCAAAPLYLYSSLKGKLDVWDELLNDQVPQWCLRHPTLDVGSGRGMVMLKVAERKKRLTADCESDHEDLKKSNIAKAYGIDTFTRTLQRSYGPIDVYKNAGALDVLDLAILHTADFRGKFPFADESFALVTSNLVLHCSNKDGRLNAMREIARVCMPEGRVVIVDLYGHFGELEAALKTLGWTDVKVSIVGFRMSYGVIPCQMLLATKPAAAV